MRYYLNSKIYLSEAITDSQPSVTECPIQPGGTRVYRFLCNEHGTSWYHSHHSAQYGDGVVGSIVIDGPASANYEIDLGPMPLTDLYYKTMYLESFSAASGATPAADNVLINGTHKNAAGGGKYNVTPLTPGRKHRLRLINTSVDTAFYVSLDSHTFQVIEADFVPIKNYTTTWLFIAIGQRYDVIIDAPLGSGNYWFRATVASGCGTVATGITSIRSIFNYVGTTLADPSSTAATQTLKTCVDEKTLVPYVAKPVPSFTYNAPTQLLPFANAGKVNGVVTWTVNASAINVDWERPTLQYVSLSPFPNDHLSLVTRHSLPAILTKNQGTLLKKTPRGRSTNS
jgi:hypothetical protein